MNDDFEDLLRELEEDNNKSLSKKEETKSKIKGFLLEKKEQPSLIYRPNHKHNTVNIQNTSISQNDPQVSIIIKNSNVMGDLLKELDMDGFSILHDKLQNNNNMSNNNITQHHNNNISNGNNISAINKNNISSYLKDLNITRQENINNNNYENINPNIKASTKDFLLELEKSKIMTDSQQINNQAQFNSQRQNNSNNSSGTKQQQYQYQTNNNNKQINLNESQQGYDMDIDSLIKEMNEENGKRQQQQQNNNQLKRHSLPPTRQLISQQLLLQQQQQQKQRDRIQSNNFSAVGNQFSDRGDNLSDIDEREQYLV